MPREPDAALRGHPLRCLLLATRPAFLTLTALGVLLGLVAAHRGGTRIQLAQAALTLLLALLVHAGANVINDVHDAAADAANSDRIYPFSGGSRFIQNGLLSVRSMALLGYGLLAAAVPGGLWLAARAGAALMATGLVGLGLAWAYSARPLRLCGRGLGEGAVALAWGLVVVGTAQVQQAPATALLLWLALAFALLVAQVLLANEFPDHHPDSGAGKRTLVVRLGVAAAARLHLALGLGAGACVGASVWLAGAPWSALLALAALGPALGAWRGLAGAREQQATAIARTLLTAHLLPVVLIGALLLG